MNAAITPHLPTYVNLYYVDYNDNLNEHSELLEETLRANNLDPIYEKVNAWWDGYDSTKSYIDEIRSELECDDIELSDDDEDEVRDWLYNNDKSTPTDDLLNNTGNITMFYSLGLEIDGWHSGFMCAPYRNSSYAQDAYKIRRVLGIQKGTKEADLIDSIVQNASGGGELRVYFSTDIKSILSENMDDDFKQIRLKGEYAIALYNSGEGSGDYESITIDKIFPFTRDNLFTSESDKYDLEDCFGMCGDWITNYSMPEFSTEPLKSKYKIAKSANTVRIAQEAEYNKIFKAGGCSAGDMDYKRHRDTYYDNNVPCGSHCPHCHTFWID